ncbi:MAG TPA: tagaturonate epimerase family protein, partial [Bacteroidales bacterium]|nr:tagaturonate epimerase family protein [Bacteroidales bacterium]
YLDADHINKSNVDRFLTPCNFFTLDVADYIGKKASDKEINDFLKQNDSFIGTLNIPGIEPLKVSQEFLKSFANNYLYATQEAGKLYQYIESKKGKENFVTEVSMDEVNEPQKPLELFFILKYLADFNVPVQTIAPRFTGRFNKGVDYEGDLNVFEKEFEADLLVIDYAVNNFGLPQNLKLSIHSGSDKFSIYPIMGRLIKNYDKGIHIKTAGTTWLEEVIGLSLGTPEGLDLAKAFYSMAYRRKDELCAPYATVIDIKMKDLPEPSSIVKWTGEEFSQTLIHNQENSRYNSSFRQLIHVAFKVAAEYGALFTEALEENREIIETCVTDNLFDRHIKRLFVLEEA